MRQCGQCGKSIGEGRRFCPYCGTRTISTTAETELVDDGRANGLVAVKPPALKLCSGEVLAGRYRLLEMLGEGGMGSVYKSQQITMNRLTAIKVLKPELANSAEFVARFAREAELASRIDHPHVAAIYDCGRTESGVVYLAMEFLDGEPLSAIVRREGPMPAARVARIARQAAEALDAAHRLGIIHRDFKPDNVMLCRKSGEKDWVKVVDFGIAKQADTIEDSLTRTGQVLGTPAYMSPEQVTGETLDARSDIYSFGLVVYNLLTGELPFTGATPQSLMVNRLVEQPRSLRQLNPSITSQVESAVMAALARECDARYSSAGAFADALHQATLAAGPVSAAELRHAPTIGQPASAAAPVLAKDASPRDVTHETSEANVLAAADGHPALALVASAAVPAPRRKLKPAAAAAATVLILASGALIAVKVSNYRAASAGPVRISPEASSSLTPMADTNFGPANAIDNQLQTAWIEGVSGPGLGQWVQCTFSREVTLHKIMIAPGYFKDPEAWASHNRVAAATFIFSGGGSRKFRFHDQMEIEALSLGSVRTRSVRIVINEVYFGSVADTAISELRFEHD